MLGRLRALFGRRRSPARVRERHEDALLAREGVVSVGLGLDGEGREAIIVGVTDAFVARGLPEALEGVPVLVRTAGRMRARDGSPD